MEINRELLRWLILIGAIPIWWPFLRTLWRDFNAALEEEGGLFGTPPGPRQIEEIERRKARAPETLVSEPWVRPGEKRLPRMRSGESRPPAESPAGFKDSARAPSKSETTRPGGFRS